MAAEEVPEEHAVDELIADVGESTCMYFVAKLEDVAELDDA